MMLGHLLGVLAAHARGIVGDLSHVQEARWPCSGNGMCAGPGDRVGFLQAGKLAGSLCSMRVRRQCFQLEALLASHHKDATVNLHGPGFSSALKAGSGLRYCSLLTYRAGGCVLA